MTLAKQSNSAKAALYPRGSEWRRWDLHVHTPGTALEDRYGTWTEYVDRLRAEQDVVVVGVTDYLSIKNYRRLRDEQSASPLGSIALLIPNIEFRLGPKTAHGHAINIHLLIDPSDPEHCERVEEALSRLSIDYQKQRYSCNEAGIRGLGAAYNGSLPDDVLRYAEGVNQYKIDPASFNEWYKSEKWLSSNSIVVISGGNDGPSGLKEDGWAAVQEELWRFAGAIFSGNPHNGVFWLAEDPENDNGARKLGAPKPCLHGSDAHELSKVFRPDDDRFCWIKSDPTFEGLRQVLYEPKERVHIGSQAPIHHDRARVISKLKIDGGVAGAFQNIDIELNSGLVAIIGQKGSGKSALADFLAYAGGVDVSSDKQSFLNRASEFVSKANIVMEWVDGHATSARPKDGVKRDKTVRYLSQSFVERLCSDDYAGSELTSEIESVIFGHLDPTDTLNTSNFSDLRELKTQQLAKERLRAALKIKQLISEDEILRETIKGLPDKKDRITQLGEEQNSLEKQVPAAENAQEAQAQTDLGGLRQQLQKMQTTVAGFKQTQLRLQQLQDQIAAFKIDFENRRVDFRAHATSVGLAEDVFDIELVLKGEQALLARASELETEILRWEGNGTGDADMTIAKLNAEIKLAEGLVAKDKAKRDQIQQLQKRIATISQEITRIQADVLAVESTNVARSKAIREARLNTYEACSNPGYVSSRFSKSSMSQSVKNYLPV